MSGGMYHSGQHIISNSMAISYRQQVKDYVFTYVYFHLASEYSQNTAPVTQYSAAHKIKMMCVQQGFLSKPTFLIVVANC